MHTVHSACAPFTLVFDPLSHITSSDQTLLLAIISIFTIFNNDSDLQYVCGDYVISVFYLIQLYGSDVVCLSIPNRVHNIVWIHLLTLSFHKISHNNIFCLRPLVRSSYSFLSLLCIFFCMSLWTIAYSLLSELELTLTVISHNSRLATT